MGWRTDAEDFIDGAKQRPGRAIVILIIVVVIAALGALGAAVGNALWGYLSAEDVVDECEGFENAEACAHAKRILRGND